MEVTLYVSSVDCSCVYIGETGRKRLKEHDYAVRTHDTMNGIAVHAWGNNHRVSWNINANKIRGFELHQTKKKLLEALFINPAL